MMILPNHWAVLKFGSAKKCRGRNLEENRKNKRSKKGTEYIEKIIEKYDVDLPEVLTHQEIHQMLQEFEQQFR